MTKIPTEIPTLLHRTMRRHSLNQQQLAHHLGVSQASVSRWMDGQRTPSPRLIQRALRDMERDLARPVGTERWLYVSVCPVHGPTSTWVSDVPPSDVILSAQAEDARCHHVRDLGCPSEPWRIAVGEPSPTATP